MKEVAKVVEAIRHTSSYNAKLDLLKCYADLPGLKEILKFIYNPYQKTGISDAKLNKAMQGWPTGVGAMVGEHAMTWQKMLDYFAINQTGSSSDLCYAREFIRYAEVHDRPGAMNLAIAIVTQNLKIGITATSLNAVYGKNFIPKVGCMLGTPFADVGHGKTKWPCIVTEKLDGVRRILIKQDGVCNFYSRSGHEDTGLVEITAEAKYLPDNFVYDGELLAAGEFKDCIAQRQATNSIANSKGAKTGLTFNVFDMVPVEDFFSGEPSADHALNRKILLGATLMDESIQLIDENWAPRIQAFGIFEDLKHIKCVPILGVVNSLTEAEPIVEKIWARGGEGIMLNTASGKYEIKRSKQLLKVKHSEEYKLQVVDILEGTGKYEDAMGAIVVNYNGSLVGVGSGFTDAQRVAIWRHPDKYIGKFAEIETFGESTNANGYKSLNCPIFKRFVGEVE